MLKFVFGRSGCGKSDYVFNQIKELAICGENNILLLTPEQYSLVAERRLLNDLGEDKSTVSTTRLFRVSPMM